MSRALPWYKREVDAWRGGTRGMSLELRGFYSELLDAMWDRQGPLPDDVVLIATACNCNPRSVRKLLPDLAGRGKIVRAANGWENPRMMRDIAAGKPANEIDVQPEFAPTSRPIRPEFDLNSTRTPTKKPTKSIGLSTEVRSQKSESEKEPPQTPRCRCDPNGVVITATGIDLDASNRAFWLDQFGGDSNALDLALMQSAAFVQSKSTRHPAVQVGAQLARIVREKRERDQRYQDGATKRKAAPPSKSSTPVYDLLMAQAGGTGTRNGANA